MRSAGWCFAVMALSGALFGEDGPAPSYKLSVGQELLYESKTAWRVGEVTIGSEERVSVWVVQRCPDGRARLLIVTTYVTSRKTSRAIASVELYRDGRAVNPNPPSYSVSSLFPRLPSADEMTAAPDEKGDNTRKITLTESGILEVESRDPDVTQFRFDGQRGLPIAWRSEKRSDVAVRTTHRTLVSTSHLDTDRLGRIRHQGEALLHAQRLLEREYLGVQRRRIHDEYKRTAKALEALRETTTEPALLALVEYYESEVDRRMRLQLETAASLDGYMGKPAPGWRLRDIGGHEHALDEYRGKVLVLDFWTKSCSFCLDAMPGIEQATQKLRAQGKVAVLGLNTEDSANEVKKIARELDIHFPLLLDGGQAKAEYGVTSYPTLVIVDGQGCIREYFVGVSPHLEEMLGQTLRDLIR